MLKRLLCLSGTVLIISWAFTARAQLRWTDVPAQYILANGMVGASFACACNNEEAQIQFVCRWSTWPLLKVLKAGERTLICTACPLWIPIVLSMGTGLCLFARERLARCRASCPRCGPSTGTLVGLCHDCDGHWAGGKIGRLRAFLAAAAFLLAKPPGLPIHLLTGLAVLITLDYSAVLCDRFSAPIVIIHVWSALAIVWSIKCLAFVTRCCGLGAREHRGGRHPLIRWAVFPTAVGFVALWNWADPLLWIGFLRARPVLESLAPSIPEDYVWPEAHAGPFIVHEAQKSGGASCFEVVEARRTSFSTRSGILLYLFCNHDTAGFVYEPGDTLRLEQHVVQFRNEPLADEALRFRHLTGRWYAWAKHEPVIDWCRVETPMWVSAVTIGLLTALLHFHRQGHAPGHCRHCGYNLTGNTSGICPECGSALPK